MGSVKDLTIINEPTSAQMGTGVFDFSNRYSVFDWGEMPDHIPNKGASLAMMSAYFFEQLQTRGVDTHYRGLQINGNTYTTNNVPQPSNSMLIDLVRVIKPSPITKNGIISGYDYSAFHDPALLNFLIPLEVIYRNTLPKGSSVFRRLKEGTLTLEEMGLKEQPHEGTVLPKPFYDVSTKLESSDRYISWKEAQRISGLHDMDMKELRKAISAGNGVITEGVSRAGLRNDDGKFEFAISHYGCLIFADTLGTLDECRFTYPLDGQWIEVSKEIPRQYHRVRQPEWVAEVEAAKKSAKDWKPLVKSTPKPMPPQLVEMISHVYTSTANVVLQRELFDAPELGEVVKEYKRFRELEMN